MSSREDQVREALASEMPTVAFVQYGPDGSTPLNIVKMFVCPLCGSCVPVPLPERPEWVFPEWHTEHHLYVARQEDTLTALCEEVRQLKDTLEPVDSRSEYPDRRPHSRACGIRKHEHGVDCHSNCPTCEGRPLDVL